MARFVDARPAPDPFLSKDYFTPAASDANSVRSSGSFTNGLAGMGRMSPVAKLIESSSSHLQRDRPDINALVPKPGHGPPLPKWASDFKQVSNYHHLRSSDVLNLHSERTARSEHVGSGRRRDLRPGAYHNLDDRTAVDDRSRWGIEEESEHGRSGSFRSSVDSQMSSSTGVQFNGWGPKTRIVPEGREDESNRDLSGRQSWPASGGERRGVSDESRGGGPEPLASHKIRLKGGFYAADVGKKRYEMGSNDAAGVQYAMGGWPAQYRIREEEEEAGGARGWDGDDGRGWDDQSGLQSEAGGGGGNDGSGLDGVRGLDRHSRDVVRATPAGLEAAKKGRQLWVKSEEEASLDLEKEKGLLAALSTTGGTLLQGIWKSHRQLLATLGPRVEKRELEQALRRLSLNHRVSAFGDAVDEVWELLDVGRRGWIDVQDLIPPYDTTDLAGSTPLSFASGSTPFGTYSHAADEAPQKVAFPEWRRRQERGRHEESRIQESVQGEMSGSLYKQRQGRRELEEASLQRLSNRTVVPGVQEKVRWHRRQDDNLQPRY